MCNRNSVHSTAPPPQEGISPPPTPAQAAQCEYDPGPGPVSGCFSSQRGLRGAVAAVGSIRDEARVEAAGETRRALVGTVVGWGHG